jgi:hypothetical protein
VDHRERYRTEDYEPGGGFRILFWTLAIFLIAAGILVSFNARYDGFSSLLWLAGALVVALAGPPLVQYVLLRGFGARPTWRSWWSSGNLYLTFWWDTDDHRLTRGQFALASGVPALLLWAVAISYAVAEPVAAGAIGFVLASCLGNLLYPALVFGKPEGTLVAKPENGLRLHVPARG